MSISANDHVRAALFGRVQNVSVFLVSDVPRFQVVGKFDDKTDPIEAGYQDVLRSLRDAGSEIRRLTDHAPYLPHERFAREDFELARERPADHLARGTRRIRFEQVADVEVRVQENAHWSLLPGCMRAMPGAALLHGSNRHLIGFFWSQVSISFCLLRHDAVESAEKLVLRQFLLGIAKQLIFREGDENRRWL